MPVGPADTMFGCGMSSPDIEMAFISSAKPPCGRWRVGNARGERNEIRDVGRMYWFLFATRKHCGFHRAIIKHKKNRERHARAQQKKSASGSHSPGVAWVAASDR